MTPNGYLKSHFKNQAIIRNNSEILFTSDIARNVIDEIEKKHFIILGLDFWISNDGNYTEINSTSWNNIFGKDAFELSVKKAKEFIEKGLPDNAEYVSFVLEDKST